MGCICRYQINLLFLIVFVCQSYPLLALVRKKCVRHIGLQNRKMGLSSLICLQNCLCYLLVYVILLLVYCFLVHIILFELVHMCLHIYIVGSSVACGVKVCFLCSYVVCFVWLVAYCVPLLISKYICV